MTHPDVGLFLWIAQGAAAHPGLLAVARALALYGSWLTVALFFWAAWRRPGERLYLLGLLVMGGLAGMAAHALSDAIGLQRPFVQGLAPAQIPHRGSEALPSAHATVMFLIAFGLAARPALRRWAPAAFVVALLTGWGRVAVAVHFPTDVLAGCLVGGLLLLPYLGLWRWLLAPLGARFVAWRRASGAAGG